MPLTWDDLLSFTPLEDRNIYYADSFILSVPLSCSDHSPFESAKTLFISTF